MIPHAICTVVGSLIWISLIGMGWSDAMENGLSAWGHMFFFSLMTGLPAIAGGFFYHEHLNTTQKRKW